MKNLMEAAADILSRSKAAAPGAPLEKVEGEVEDLGGVTPTKPERAEGDGAAKNVKKATAPGKPAAVAAAPMEVVKEEDEKNEDEEEDEKEEKDEKEDKKEDEEEEEDAKKSMKEDVDAILASESNLSEEFRSKVTTIFEARVKDKVGQIKEQLDVKYTQELTEAVKQLETQLVEKVDGFLSYVVEEWMEQNQVAIENGLRTELTEEFIGGLRNLFAEHYISVPEEKISLVDELVEKVETLEKQLNETVARNIEIKNELKESKKQDIIGTVCEGLTQTQTEKIRSLVEGTDFAAEGEFQKKVETIRENYFPKTIKSAPADMLMEQTELVDQPEVTDSRMKAYMKAITKTSQK